MTGKAMEHIIEAVRKGLGPSGVVEAEARQSWSELDEIERFRLRRELGISTMAQFIHRCEQLAGEERLRKAREDCHLAAFFGRERCV